MKRKRIKIMVAVLIFVLIGSYLPTYASETGGLFNPETTNFTIVGVLSIIGIIIAVIGAIKVGSRNGQSRRDTFLSIIITIVLIGSVFGLVATLMYVANTVIF